MTDTYRIHPDETWARAREDYLSGETAEEVCRRYDLSLRTLRDRAGKEKWRRADQPFAVLEPDDLTIFNDYENRDLVEMARLRMVAAITRGNATEANRWRRVYQFWLEDVRAMNRWMAEERDHEKRLAMRQGDAGG